MTAMLERACYLDWNAAAPIHPDVVSMLQNTTVFARNPSSPHQFGRAARATLECARSAILTSVDATHMKAIFTSSGTEANNTALLGLGFRYLFISEGEHASVSALKESFAGEAVTIIPLNAYGVTDEDALRHALKQCPEPSSALISIMAANNETGILHNISSYADIARSYGARLHCDASQAFGKIDFSAKDTGADVVTLSAHKAGGLAGAAALLIPPSYSVDPLIHGGGQEGGARSGTENTLAIEAFGIIAERVNDIRKGFSSCASAMRVLEERLESAGGDSIRIYGKYRDTCRLPNTCCVATKHLSAETQLISCDLAGVAISAGSACSSGKIIASPVLKAIDRAAGITDDAGFSGCAVRISMGPGQGDSELQRFFSVWKQLFASQGS